MKHWLTDTPKTVDQALELLQFGAVFEDALSCAIDQARTEKRMISAADFLARHIEKIEKEAQFYQLIRERGDILPIYTPNGKDMGMVIATGEMLDRALEEELAKIG